MPNEDISKFPEGLDVNKLLAELEVPFPPVQVLWRVTNTSNDKKRGQIVAYADPRAYTDRLNALVSPQGWTRDYRIETMNSITRVKKGESIITGKVLVTCTVTILGLWSHSGTGEEWADDDNGMTSADAQAFKRACSCFGLGRYFYDFNPPWVDLDQHRQPLRAPTLPAWAVPENWRKGMRASDKHKNGNAAPIPNGGRNGNSAGAVKTASANDSPGARHANGNLHGNGQPVTPNGNSANGSHQSGAGGDGSDLDGRILRLEQVVGTMFYRSILREYGRVNQPKLIRDLAVKEKVLCMLESATRGLDRLNALAKPLDPNTLSGLLAKLQAPPLDQIKDMKTLQQVVSGLEGLAGPQHHQA